MRIKYAVVLVLVVCLCLPAQALFAKSKFWKMSEWFSKRKNSTTVTGLIDSVDGRRIMFKTHDGQLLQLIGRDIEKIQEHRGATIRIFGNVKKPDAKYPSGALDIRNFRVLEEAPVVAAQPQESLYTPPETAAEPEPVYEPYYEPQPVEPQPEPVPEPIVVTDQDAIEPYDDNDTYDDYADDDAAQPEPAVTTREYVVKSGDTLAKISSEMYGTTQKWREIAQHNNISNPKALKVGMTLQIP